MYTELLKLCGYDDQEIETERPRVEKAFKKLGLGPEDIERGENRTRKLFDTSLEGMRMSLGIWMKELIDLTLSKDEGKKIVYANYPSIKPPYLAAMYASDDLYVGTPELVLDIVMGMVFDKINPLIEAGEENGLAPGLAHCALLQARIGAITQGIIPMPDFLLNSSHFCDQSPKTDELIHELYGVPIAYIDSIMDQNWGDWPETSGRRIEYLGARMNQALEKLGEVLDIKVTEESWQMATRENAKGWANYLTLIELVAGSDPQPISQADLSVPFWIVFGTPTRRVDDYNKAIGILLKEVKQRVDQGKGVVEKGAPRVGWYLPSAVEPEMFHMVEECGISIAVNYSGWVTPMELTRPNYRAYAERHAENTLRTGPVHSVQGFIERWKVVCERWNLDGVIHNYLFSCRPLCMPAFMIKKAIQDDLNIPVLALEYDVWDKRDYGVGQVRTRVETFAELVKGNKAMKG